MSWKRMGWVGSTGLDACGHWKQKGNVVSTWWQEESMLRWALASALRAAPSKTGEEGSQEEVGWFVFTCRAEHKFDKKSGQVQPSTPKG